MSCNRKIGSFLAAGEPRFRSCLCLLVLLPYLLLPLIYYNHLAGNVSSPFSRLEGTQVQGAIFWGKAAKPIRPLHGPACPICQGASSFCDYGISFVALTPDHPALVRLQFFSNYPAPIANLHLLASGPRAPPVAL